MSRYTYLTSVRRGRAPLRLASRTKDDIPIGVVVNPKLRQPVLVLCDNDYSLETQIVSMGDSGLYVLGKGYIDQDDEVANMSGFPRTHTPDGVALKNRGFGTCLYTGLNVASHQQFERRYKQVIYMEDGVSSGEGRSAEAARWWNASVTRGLAHRVDYDDEQQIDLDNWNTTFDEACATDCVEPDDEDVQIDDVNLEVSVSGTGTKTVHQEYDVYSFESATEHSIVVAAFHPGDWKQFDWRTLEQKDLIDEVDVGALLALDVRDLSQDSINLLLTLARYGGAAEADVDALHVRWDLGLDPEADIKQQLLPFKPNSSERRFIAEALDRAGEARADANWDNLADLP